MKQIASAEQCVDEIIARVGKQIRVGAPLGIGKANHLLNALYARAKQDPGLSLHVYTALTLQRPVGSSELEKRFLEPMVERVFGNYPDLDYETDRLREALPANVRVYEFYFQAGKYLKLPSVQRDYISTNYTYVARDLAERGVNVLMQEVACETRDGELRLSLSSNPDVSLELADMLEGRDGVISIGQTNAELPFMYGDAEIEASRFDLLVHSPAYDHSLFGPPKLAVNDVDTMIGLYASTLVKDGGELQIGIGSLGDALTYALCLRQRDNERYRQVLDALDVAQRAGDTITRLGSLAPFELGLFSATEMLVDGFQHLWEAGILKRRVYDDVALQRLLNEGLISEEVTPDTLRLLHERRALGRWLSARELRLLQHFGVLRAEVRWEDDSLLLPNGERITTDLDDPTAFETLCRHGLGTRLQGGSVIHAGFFLGPQSFYRWLRELPEEQRRLINMRGVHRINQLYGHETLDRLHRTHARFINTGLLVTLSGAVASDGLEDGRVVSGVGGQYNFVAMAHALPDGHSVIQIRATRSQSGELKSNIVPSYGHTTIARHQRDLVVTEYGVADLRGKTDEEIIQALLNVADSRFQSELIEAAKASGKLSADYEIPATYRHNLPDSYTASLSRLRGEGLFPAFPFGTDLTEHEIVLAEALQRLKARTESTGRTLEAFGEAVLEGSVDADVLPYLERMGLANPGTLREMLYQRLLVTELRKDARVQDPD